MAFDVVPKMTATMDNGREIDDRIIGAALKILHETLVDNLESNWSSGVGTPPVEGTIILRPFKKRDHPHSMEPPIRQWSLDKTGTTEVNIDSDFYKPGEIDGMFYEKFSGWFEVSPDQGRFEIGWQTDPRVKILC